MKRMAYRVTRYCALCGTCVFECPVGAIRLESKGARIDEGKCAGCGKCAANCASEAIERVQIEAEDVACVEPLKQEQGK